MRIEDKKRMEGNELYIYAVLLTLSFKINTNQSKHNINS